jgi:tetratricopeptide (TPR) repeat protein
MRNSARILLLTTACCYSLFGQAKGGGAPPAGPTTGNTTNNLPTPTPAPTPTTPNQNTQPTFSRPMYVAGRVVMDDGTAPPTSVTIVRVCNGVTRSMGYTSAKGDFSFDMNHADSTFQDASTPGIANLSGDPTSTRASLDDPLSGMRGATGATSGGMGGGMGNSSALMGCELRAQFPGYRSSAVQLANRRSMDDPDVGMIILHRMGKDEGTTVSMTSMMAPKDAKKAYDKGLEALKKKKLEDADKEFQKAVVAYPKYADAWFHLGALQMDQKNVEKARSSFNQAIAADPKLVTPYVDLAILDARDAKWKEVSENTGKAIRLDPVDFPVAFYFDALANYNLQNFDAAEKSARQLQKLDTQHRYPLADRILASVLADRKDYSGAAQQMRNYLKFAGANKDADEVRGQLQQLEKLITEQSAESKQ